MNHGGEFGGILKDRENLQRARSTHTVNTNSRHMNSRAKTSILDSRQDATRRNLHQHGLKTSEFFEMQRLAGPLDRERDKARQLLQSPATEPGEPKE